MAEIGLPLLICLNCAGGLLPLSTLQQQAYFRYQLVGLPLSVICSGRPIELDKPHVLALAAETGFCNLKSKFPLILKIKYQRFNGNGRSPD
jgi:hypothetical protein